MAATASIGDYTLLNTLGVGTFGKVKLAEHIPTGQQVAIKIINKARMLQMNMNEKLSREVNILKMMTHPHVIRLFELLDSPTEIFMVMEYVSGGELFDYIVHKVRLRESEGRRLFQQIVAGVEFCHSHLICHRDIKPENLLLDRELHIKIADFGLSNRMRDGEFLKTSCGSPNYASPEVVSGRFYSGPEVDVWSCGVVLYALLCGSLPFDDENVPNLFRKIKHGNFTLPGHITSDAKDLIVQMLVVDPSKRLTIPMIRKHRWFRMALPDYLKQPPPPQLTTTGSSELLFSRLSSGDLDASVLEDLKARGYSPKEETLGYRERVAYNLLRHNKEKQLAYSLNSPSNRQAEVEPISGMFSASELEEIALVNCIAPLPDPIPMDIKDLRSTSGVPTPSSQVAMSQIGSLCKWVLGFEVTLPSVTVNRELQQTMHALDFVWYGTTPWKYRVRSRSNHTAFQLSVCVYKLQTQRYIIDVSLHSGEFCSAVDAACTLIQAIANNSRLNGSRSLAGAGQPA